MTRFSHSVESPSNGADGPNEVMLVQQLRESCGYLSDAGWEQSARLMLLAADEIERLTAQLAVSPARPINLAGRDKRRSAPSGEPPSGRGSPLSQSRWRSTDTEHGD